VTTENESLGQAFPLVDAVALEHRLTSMESSFEHLEQRIDAWGERLVGGTDALVRRMDIQNGRIAKLEEKEAARAVQEKVALARVEGAMGLKLTVKGWMVAGFAAATALVSAVGAVYTLAERFG